MLYTNADTHVYQVVFAVENTYFGLLTHITVDSTKAHFCKNMMGDIYILVQADT